MAKKRTATFLGPNKGLSIAGNHAYAYSGVKQANTATYTLFNFTSGNYYFVGEITVSGATDNASPGVGLTSVFTVSMNGTQIMLLKTDTDQEDMPTTVVVPILIAPYTVFELDGIDNGTTANRETSASIVGRIYRDT